jgi:carbon storage regulator
VAGDTAADVRSDYVQSWGQVRMLILSRRPGDAILIDGGIRIVVLASGHRSVRLGIEAPSEVGIVREEIAGRDPAGTRSMKIGGCANGAPETVPAPVSPPTAAEAAQTDSSSAD